MKVIRGKKHCGAEHGIDVESILLFDLEKVTIKYDKKFFHCLDKKEYTQCEQLLSDFCFELLDLSEQNQDFIVRTYFVSIITDIIRIQSRKDRLHPRILSYCYKTIATIEKWENITEYLLSIPWFMQQISTYIIEDNALFGGNTHVEKALTLINQHMESDYLTVQWLALQLGISTTHLSNLFKLQIGETITKYIANRKIEEITFELTYTNKSLKTIREKYGFVNHSHFIQHFKRIKGITPLQFKQALLK